MTLGVNRLSGGLVYQGHRVNQTITKGSTNMSKLYLVLDSEHQLGDVGFNEGGCGVFSTYKDALESAKEIHSRPYGTAIDKDCPYFDYQILIVDVIGHSINQQEVLLT